MNIIKNLSIEKIFAIITLFFGMLYVFILPPFQSVDEGMHFFRTYEISTGKFVAQNVNGKIGDYLPQSLSNFYDLYTPFIKNIDKKTSINDIKRNLRLELNPNQITYTQFTNTALYSPLCYISQIPGVLLAKLFNLPLAFIYYFGRISNLISYCILVYFAIRIIPCHKLSMMALALMPMSLSLAAAYTCDVAVIGLNFLWIALLLKTLVNKEFPLGEGGFAVLAFLIALCKSYVLLLPLILLLPLKNFKNLKHYLFTILSTALCALTGFGIWYLTSKGLTLNMNDTVADYQNQLIFIKSHPIEYILVLIKTFLIKTPRLYITMIGVLGWQDTKLDWITYLIYPAIIYISMCADSIRIFLQHWQKSIILISTILGIILTYTSLYIMWTPVGNDVVLGLNGKYFIPMVLPILLLFNPKRINLDYDKVKIIVALVIILILFSSELSLLHRFYDITPQLYYKI